MELTTTVLESEVVVVTCDGRLNMVAAPRLSALLDQVVADGHARIVVDLAATSFIDSSGLGALVGGLKKARQGGGDLRIAAPGDQARTVLELTNLDRVLRPHDRVEDAAHDW